MTATTPFLTNEDMLGPLASRYVDVDSLPWKPTPCAGIDMKILLEDKESGLMTALFRWQAGAELALHEHVEVEQTFVLQGSLVDEEGEVTSRARQMARWCCRCFSNPTFFSTVRQRGNGCGRRFA
jgi:anti-sigma factor ChrR (cupin superfamily)